MNPFKSRLWRTIILFLAGIAVCLLVAIIFAPTGQTSVMGRS